MESQTSSKSNFVVLFSYPRCFYNVALSVISYVSNEENDSTAITELQKCFQQCYKIYCNNKQLKPVEFSSNARVIM